MPTTSVSASTNSSSARELLDLVEADTDVVGIDEGQFFDQELPTTCNELADRGKRVIVAGLDQDYRGLPFEPMPQLLAIAEYITKTLAICVVCGEPASRTQKNRAEGGRVVVGGAGLYEARCRRCHTVPTEDQAHGQAADAPPSAEPVAPPVQEIA